MEITAFFTNNSVPLVAPGTLPTIRIRRIDTQALVVTDSNMTEIGDGLYSFDFAPDSALDYTTRADGDPLAAGQVKKQERYVAGSFNANIADIHGQVTRAVYIDTESVPLGNGYQQTPWNNWSDAVDDAEDNGLKHLVVLADAVVDRQLKNFVIVGVGFPVLDLNGQIMTKSTVEGFTLQGTYTDPILATRCVLDDNFELNGAFLNCLLNGDLTVIAGSEVNIVNCASAIAGIIPRPTISLNLAGAASELSVRNYSGGLTILDMNQALDLVTIEMAQGKLTLAASLTDGIISVRGLAQFTDNSAGTTVDRTGLQEPERTDDLWQNEGLDPDNSKVITEITEGADYDEDVGTIHKDVTRVGAITTLDRT
jgi:hypothetical protein